MSDRHGVRAMCVAAHVRPRARAAALACALLLAAPLPARAQKLTGSVADATSREPIVLALVALVDSAGTVLQQVLTNETGRFVMTPRGAGRVRLRVERIGYASAYEPFFTLAPDTERDVQILISVQPITLEGIAVTDERYCSINAQASETLRVWTEARKALAAAAVAERQRLFRFSGVTFRREVAATGTVAGLYTRPFMDSYRQPFVSRPAADLTQHGYIRADATGLNFFAPNAEVLLSAEFEQSNCFSLTRNSAAPDRIGVRFTPNRRQDVPAISGVAWLDTRTAALRFVEFDYVNTGRFRFADLANGRVELQMLPNGGWVISRWFIRMPKNVSVEGPRARVVTFVEDGGEVRSATMAGRQWGILATGSIVGVVFDSTTGRVLGGADIAVPGTALSARTDAAGSFRIGNLPAGIYTVALWHPRLDTLPPYPPQLRTVQVQGADTVRVALAIPPLERSVIARCLDGMKPDMDRIAVYGTLRDEATSDPVARARLRLSWDSVFSTAGQFRSTPHTVNLETDEDGRYIACDLPGGMSIRAEVLSGGRPRVQLDFHTRNYTFMVGGRSMKFQPLIIPGSTMHPPNRSARSTAGRP